jgi:hypothetical protein
MDYITGTSNLLCKFEVVTDAFEKIETLAFVPSNSENISCVAFLKHKNSKNRELALWRLVGKLVSKNA